MVRYARTYLREVGHGAGRGLHPLDLALGLVGDRFSWNVLTMSARLGTKLSFAEARTKRCDHGGMRWIEERVEAIVPLRCIEANGDWDHFIEFVHKRMRADAQRANARLRLQSSQPADLPTLLEAA